MVTAAGVRIGWVELPERVRRAVAEILGGAVVEASSQVGGFSPGTADRVRTAAGARAFVKAVSAAQNEHSPNLHRQEALITAALPPPRRRPRCSAPTTMGTGSRWCCRTSTAAARKLLGAQQNWPTSEPHSLTWRRR